jgi:hypothetical protein
LQNDQQVENQLFWQTDQPHHQRARRVATFDESQFLRAYQQHVLGRFLPVSAARVPSWWRTHESDQEAEVHQGRPGSEILPRRDYRGR